jgi:hypothetical protein
MKLGKYQEYISKIIFAQFQKYSSCRFWNICCPRFRTADISRTTCRIFMKLGIYQDYISRIIFTKFQNYYTCSLRDICCPIFRTADILKTTCWIFLKLGKNNLTNIILIFAKFHKNRTCLKKISAVRGFGQHVRTAKHWNKYAQYISIYFLNINFWFFRVFKTFLCQ